MGGNSKIAQSGSSENFSGKMTKRGSPFLKIALFHAAPVASNTDLQAFYQKKRSENKHHLTCNDAVARKFYHTVQAILSKNFVYKIQSTT